jgi:flagellar hook capping protein FlgD
VSQRLYENFTDPQWTPGSEPLGRQPFLDAFNAGNDLVIVWDHQTLTEMGMGGAEVVDVPDIQALSNTVPHSHVFLWAGEGPLGPASPIGPAFFHTPGGSPGGAVTVVGLTHFAFPTALRYYADEYFRLLIDENVRALGETLGRSRLPFVPFSQYDGVNRWTQMTLAMFGDPQLSLPRRASLDLALSAPSTVNVGESGIPVHVTEDGVARQGVIVTAYREAEGIVTATTDAQGNAVVPFVALTPGEISLTARQDGSPTEVASTEATSTTDVPGRVGIGRFAFAAPSPNPSSGDVFFRWTVPADLAGVPARLTIYDLAGRVVRTLELGAGAISDRSLTWDGRDATGADLGQGLYVARLVVGNRALERAVVRMR